MPMTRYTFKEFQTEYPDDETCLSNLWKSITAGPNWIVPLVVLRLVST